MLLYLDPLIAGISAQLSDGSQQGKQKLRIAYNPADSFDINLGLNNSRSPSIGSFQKQAVLREANLLGLGDGLTVGYSNTDGSDGFDFSYTIPINSRNGTLGFSYGNTSSNIIEPPFNDLDKDGSGPDIASNFRSYGLDIRQPLIHNIVGETVHEFAMGLKASWRETNSSILGLPFPLSPGAEDDGFTRIFSLGFYQEYTLQNSRNLLFLRSQFNWGLDGFDSTVNEQIPGVETIPDSRFFSWQGQAQYLRFLDPEDTDKRLLLRLNGQIADRTLVPGEQFSIGGLGSVRGYRQSTLVADNGVFGSAELQWPVLRVLRDSGVIQLIPFVDAGAGWNSSAKADPDPNFLAAVGLGVQWQQGNSFTARLDWGVPLVSVDSRERTWQGKRVAFFCTLEFILGLWQWLKCSINIFGRGGTGNRINSIFSSWRWLISRNLLVLFLLGIFLSASVLPAMSQINIANSPGQKYFLQAERYYKAENFSQATEYLERTAEIFRREEKWESLAVTLTNLGHCRLVLGQPQEALRSWQEAAKLYQGLNEPEGAINSQIGQIEALQALGRHQQARAKGDNLKDSIIKLPNSSTKARGLQILGDVLRTFGNLEDAKTSLVESLKVARRLQLDQEVSSSLVSLGNIFNAKAERIRILQDDPTTKYDYFPWRCDQQPLPEAASEQYGQAIKQYEEAIAQSPLPLNKVQIQLNELQLQVARGELAAARALWSKIDLSQFPATSPSQVYGKVKLAKSLVCLKEGTPLEALPAWEDINNLLNQAVAEAQPLENNLRVQSSALGNLAGFYEYLAWLSDKHQQASQAQNYREKARGLTRKALNFAQSIDAPDLSYQWQWQLARLWRAEGERQKALESYILTAETVDNFRQYSGAIASNLRQLNSDLNFYFRQNVEPAYRQLIELLLEPDGVNSKPSASDIEKARHYFQKFQAAEIESFFICSLQEDSKRISIDEFIDTKQLNTVAIYPIVMQNKLGVILKLPNTKKTIYYTSKKREDILGYIKGQIEPLSNNSNWSEAKKSAYALYELLLEPAKKELASYFASDGEKTLVFVPDSPLSNIPLAALYESNNERDDNEKFLINKTAVVLSTGWLLKDSKPFQNIELDSLIVAVEDPQVKGFEKLEYIETEVNGIEIILDQAKVFFDKNSYFDKRKLKENINKSSYNLIHLATHGKFSSDLRNTFVIAAPTQKVYLNELEGLLQSQKHRSSQTLDLLVFSACETVSDDKRAVLGIAGAAVEGRSQ